MSRITHDTLQYGLHSSIFICIYLFVFIYIDEDIDVDVDVDVDERIYTSTFYYKHISFSSSLSYTLTPSTYIHPIYLIPSLTSISLSFLHTPPNSGPGQFRPRFASLLPPRTHRSHSTQSTRRSWLPRTFLAVSPCETCSFMLMLVLMLVCACVGLAVLDGRMHTCMYVCIHVCMYAYVYFAHVHTLHICCFCTWLWTYTCICCTVYACQVQYVHAHTSTQDANVCKFAT